ncbi:MAG: alpha-hydroxy acid oxidase, partial [Pseudomonadota bacterium]
GFVGLFHPRCGPAFAKRSKELGLPYALSFVSSSSTESIIAAMDGTPPWQQFYWPDDEDVQDDIIARMKALGVKVIMPTVDIPGFQWRERSVRAGSSGQPPLHILARDIIQRPRWALDMLKGPIPRLPNIAPYCGSDKPIDGEKWLVEHCTRPMGVGEIKKLRDKWDGKLVVKGVMAVEDAEAYAKIGVDGIVVSNHGGRQLDAAPAAAELLPPIAAAVKGKVAIIADSGVASGLDALRMLRLGADFVMIGRLAYYAAAALGEDGSQVLDLMKLQIRTVMTQLGIRSLDELDSIEMKIG